MSLIADSTELLKKDRFGFEIVSYNNNSISLEDRIKLNLATTNYYPYLLLGTMALNIGIATLLPAIATAPMSLQLVIYKLNDRSVNIL
ncbi:hypothetical protein [Chamaesiphon polymorphus]|uniref:Uncharacterized protein n=1 Tax=Chamaesiphon polymorphus CCALA 037 TaxID=2107692 RepID=A0A2T1FR82_9CYAN|nr:hypothetical protein [Chamaesiphon polymorphus]PSB47485.1 hypothetical protein C7B77_24280 [Chamaesiphon polymorphus CCALA 037]